MNNLDYFNTYFSQKVMPLVYDESLSYYEVINKLITFTNNLITDVNKIIDFDNSLKDDYSNLLENLNKLTIELEKVKDGQYIKDGSITNNKLSQNVYTHFREYILNTVYQTAKFLSFGINEEGYFYADIPKNWNDVVFSTDENGRLILTM